MKPRTKPRLNWQGIVRVLLIKLNIYIIDINQLVELYDSETIAKKEREGIP
jgi:hypothetical protein